MKRKKSRYIDNLPLAALAFDPTYQREISNAAIRKLVRDWNENALGVIHVSIRADRKAYVVDGQHRVRAGMDKGLGDFKVQCVVHKGLSRQEEAELFLLLNAQKNISAYDRYKAGLVAEDPECLGIQETLDHYGLRISNGSTEGSVRCIGEVTQLYKKDPEVLDAVFLTLTEAWGTRILAFEQVVVGGVGRVIDRYNGQLDEAVLIKKLSGYRGGPSALAGNARGLADLRVGTAVKQAAAEIIVDTYNKGRRSGQLPPV